MGAAKVGWVGLGWGEGRVQNSFYVFPCIFEFTTKF